MASPSIQSRPAGLRLVENALGERYSALSVRLTDMTTLEDNRARISTAHVHARVSLE